jgi:hypothetical protein
VPEPAAKETAAPKILPAHQQPCQAAEKLPRNRSQIGENVTPANTDAMANGHPQRYNSRYEVLEAPRIANPIFP